MDIERGTLLTTFLSSYHPYVSSLYLFFGPSVFPLTNLILLLSLRNFASLFYLPSYGPL